MAGLPMEIHPLINNIRNNSKSYVYNAGVVLANNISEYVDFNINYSLISTM